MLRGWTHSTHEKPPVGGPDLGGNQSDQTSYFASDIGSSIGPTEAFNYLLAALTGKVTGDSTNCDDSNLAKNWNQKPPTAADLTEFFIVQLLDFGCLKGEGG